MPPGVFDTGDDEQTDNGVPVGEADAEADRERASGELDSSGNEEPDDDLGRGTTTDAGVPVGSADAEEDRRRASGDVSEDT